MFIPIEGVETMKLTTKGLQRFVGGKIEIQNMGEGYLYRGEIETIEVTDGDKSKWPGIELDNYGDLRIKPRLLKKLVDGEWEKDENPEDYVIGLPTYSAADIGEGRIFLNGTYNGESTTLFPPA